MEEIVFAINPADLQFANYLPEEKTSPNFKVFLILLILVAFAFLVWWCIKQYQSDYELFSKSENLNKPIKRPSSN